MLVQTQFLVLPSIKLECQEKLEQIKIAYETYGKLNQAKNNAILVCHALTGDSHAAGKYQLTDRKPGWWDSLIGPGKALDTNQYFIIASNVLGGCTGSTGPASLNPQTNQAYALKFPFITIKDMVSAQAALIKTLGIKELKACIGGSMGGMQVLEWAISFPNSSKAFVILASAPYQSTQNIALHEVGRQAIMNDTHWQKGNYYGGTPPSGGLSVARMIAHITYLSDQTMYRKFGRRLQTKNKLDFALQGEFEVESYLSHQGRTFVKRFDANSYLYITRAVDYFDYSGGKLQAALDKTAHQNHRFLIISFDSDWLYPSYQSLEIVQALQANNLAVSYCQLNSPYGHDAFLLEVEQLTPLISNFLKYL